MRIADFIVVYNETFKYIYEKDGPHYVKALWRAISENYCENLDKLIREKGLEGMLEYWGGALEEEKDDHHGDFFEVPGRVLHLDGDKDYLEKCMRSYIQMEVPARGFHVPEKEQPQAIEKILAEYTADILVLTGHDGFVKGTQDFSRVDNYHNSKYFAEAVRTARKLDPSRNGLVIFAGACQSHYESLLEAGANFASSPQRVLIHAFDPVFLVEKIAYTSFTELVSLKDIIENTITGEDGIGGIETHGRFRMGYPKSPY